MIWKKRHSNLIVVSLLSIAYTIVSFLVAIGPLHINAEGEINQLTPSSFFILLYWLASLAISWGLYFAFKRKPEFLFFTLMILGIAIIIAEIFLWPWVGY